jgi:hypothetical protein
LEPVSSFGYEIHPSLIALVQENSFLGLMMRTSPRWIRTSHGLLQVTSHHQLGLHVWFGFSRPPWMESATTPSYDIETRRSLMLCKANDESFLLVLILDLEHSWIIVSCQCLKVLRHLFWAKLAFVSCRALSSCCGRPPIAPNPRSSPFCYKLSSHHHIWVWILFSYSFSLRNRLLSL